jgi:hypothetical protein
MAGRKPTKPIAKLPEDPVSHYFRVLEEVQVKPASGINAQKIDMDEEIAREQKIKNDNAEQDIQLKRTTLNRLFWFLTVETAFIFAFAFCQAVGWPAGFALEDWSFRLVVGATIAQITGMLFVAVRYLFPTNNKER